MNILHKETNIFGLKYFPWFEQDNLNYLDIVEEYTNPLWPQFGHYGHFTDDNVVCLILQMSQIQQMNSILEIGVNRPNNSTDHSSTKTIFSYKKPECLYLGVDIEDKTYLNDTRNNIFTLETDSSNYDNIVLFLKQIDMYTIDLLFIDGNHSIFNTANDWKFAKLLSIGGKVIMHDVTQHQGPIEIMNAVDENYFKIEKFCPKDHGLGIFTRIK